MTAAHYIALLLLSTAAEGSTEHAEIVRMNDAGIWLSLSDLKLVERAREQGLWYLTERGRVLVAHILELPLPEPVSAWRMPASLEASCAAWERDDPRRRLTSLEDAFAEEPARSIVDGALHRLAAGILHSPSADLAADDDTPPPRPPPPKPIHGITPAADPDERMKQAGELLDRGFGLNEVAETLEMDAGAIDRHFYPGGP